MQEEISLREILETLWRGKIIIVVLTIVSILIATVFSFGIVSPTYEAISTVRLGNGSIEDHGHNLIALSESTMTDVSLRRVIDKLGLSEGQYTITKLRENIQVEPIKDTSLIKLKVTGENPETITNIANIIAFELGFRTEITDRSQIIVEDKKKLTNLNDEILISTKALEVANNLLKDNPEKITTIQTLADNPYLQAILSESYNVQSKNAGALKLESETINPVHSTLKQIIADTTINLTKFYTERDRIETNIKENEIIIAELEQQLITEKLKTIKSERLLDGYNAVFISPAIEPIEPVAPRKLLNIIFSAVVGIILSVLYIMARYFWIKTPATTPSESKSYPYSN